MTTRFFIIMGVSGSGKTAVGRALADRLGWRFYDADSFHPPANIAKMSSGMPLNDEDREPWLAVLHDLIASCMRDGQEGVLACSALKERYRTTLLEGNADVRIIYLKGTYELIWKRISGRKGHYMKPAMLQSQFDALEEPGEDAIWIDTALPVNTIVKQILAEP